MSASSALGWLALASARGRVRQLGRRVRSARHVVGMLVALGWLAFVFAANRVQIARVAELRAVGGPAWAAELLGVVVLGLFLAIAWVLVPTGNVLGFSEPEVHVLFAAPLTRRQLVAYKLAQSAAGSLVGVLLLAAVFGRGGAGDRAMLAGGLWIAIFTLSLHGAGAGLTRAALVQRGVSGARRRVLTLALAAAVPVAAVLGWWSAPPLAAFPSGLQGVAEWTRALLGTAPLSWVVFPLRLVLGPACATSGASFAAALPGGLAVLAMHVGWVFSSDAAFQELTLESAARASARVAAVQSGVVPLAVGRGRRRSFRLRPGGRPEAAIAWKALVRGTRGISIPLVAAGAAFALTMGVAAIAGRDARVGAAPLVAVMALVFFAISLFGGPMAFSGDLRRDAPHLELLRALPLRGRQVLAGEIAVPYLQTVAAQWALVALWLASAGGVLFPGSRAEHAAIALAMAIGGPALSSVTFTVANGLVVLYPEWAGSSPTSTSPLERLGGRNLAGIVAGLASAIAFAPAVLAGALVGVLASNLLGTWAVTAGALAGAATAAIEVGLALPLLGRAFERIDLSA